MIKDLSIQEAKTDIMNKRNEPDERHYCMGGLARILTMTLLGCGLCWGQVTDECKPSSLNIPGAPYPCVYPDRRVAFRVAAPDAQKVQVRLGGTHDMTRGPDGLWTVTIPPQVVGFHYYSIVVDGAVMADPATRTFFGSGWDNSGIEIPEPNGDYYSAKDVPHGEVRQRWYFSKVTGNGAAASSTHRPIMTPIRAPDPKTSNKGVFADSAAFNKKVRVLFLGIGSLEGPGTKNFSDALTAAGIHNVYFESPGTAHEWLTWRRSLNDFAPRLFP